MARWFVIPLLSLMITGPMPGRANIRAAESNNLKIALGPELSIETILAMNSERKALLGRQLSSRQLQQLREIIFSEKSPYPARWQAVTFLAYVPGNEGFKILDACQKSKIWFLKNASLLAMEERDKKSALKWAKRMLHDEALVVRSQATTVLGRLGDKEGIELLWKELYQDRNFRGNQSLWIRRQIVESLARLKSPGDQTKFQRILKDPDSTLHPVALQALAGAAF